MDEERLVSTCGVVVVKTYPTVKNQALETGVNQKLGVISSPKRFRITEGEMSIGKITLR